MTSGFKVVNIVGSSRLGVFIDLKLLLDEMPDLYYNPEIYHAGKIRFDDLGVTVCVVKSGTLLFSGARSIELLNHAKTRILSMLSQLIDGIPNDVPVRIDNMVALSSVGSPVDLDKSSQFQSEEINSLFLPERHPALIVRVKKQSTATLVYANGKMVISGAKSHDAISETIAILSEILHSS